MPSPHGQGRIVWVTVADTQGENQKTRPAVILTATADINPDGEILVAAITTDIGRTRSSETVELPSDPAGHPTTRLKKPCEVVCSWVASVPAAQVRDTGGSVPSEILAEILAKVQRLA
jgi:mRNA-degrading endonuclease toxin of MazEF toxin-antitoxin module